jgi:hypothetical protein
MPADLRATAIGLAITVAGTSSTIFGFVSNAVWKPPADAVIAQAVAVQGLVPGLASPSFPQAIVALGVAADPSAQDHDAARFNSQAPFWLAAALGLTGALGLLVFNRFKPIREAHTP